MADNYETETQAGPPNATVMKRMDLLVALLGLRHGAGKPPKTTIGEKRCEQVVSQGRALSSALPGRGCDLTVPWAHTRVWVRGGCSRKEQIGIGKHTRNQLQNAGEEQNIADALEREKHFVVLQIGMKNGTIGGPIVGPLTALVLQSLLFPSLGRGNLILRRCSIKL